MPKHTHQYLCKCFTSGCCDQKFVDDQGQTQKGLYVTYGTFCSHELADKRANSITSTLENYLSPKKPNPLKLLEGSVQDFTLKNVHWDNSLKDLREARRFSVDDPELPDISPLILDWTAETSGQQNILGNGTEPQKLSARSHPSTPIDPSSPCNQSTMFLDCSRYHKFSLTRAKPAILHTCLVVAILSVLEHCSDWTCAWLLGANRQQLELVVRQGLFPNPHCKDLLLQNAENLVLNDLPTDVWSVIRWLEIDPVFTQSICCPQCFAMYPEGTNIPSGCIHTSFHKSSDDLEPLLELETDASSDTTKGWTVCGAMLFQQPPKSSTPIRCFVTQGLLHWLGRLFSRPDIESVLEESARQARKPYSSGVVSDIHELRIWKSFLGPDGSQFTAHSNHLTFSMFVYGINPYGNRITGKHASITFIVLVCLSLPMALCYQHQNIFVVAIAPGPNEPSLEQINWILRPTVEELKTLWTSGLHLLQRYKYPEGRLVYAALLPFFANLPALRRALGFAAPTATRMCSFCLLKRPDIKNIEPDSWPKNNLHEHKIWAQKSRDALTLNNQKKILRDQGVRYPVLLELPYWDVIQYHVVDSMHNLLLGLLKWHCLKFWKMTEDYAEPEPTAGVSTKELLDLLALATLTSALPPKPLLESDKEEEIETGTPFNKMDFNSADSSDPTFQPLLGTHGWESACSAPDEGQAVFDGEVLRYINQFLPRIRIPTWVKRAIPVLGKA